MSNCGYFAEVQEALSEAFDGVECSISPGPVLSQLPFRQPFRHLGRNVIYVPDVTVSCMEDIDSTTLSRLNLSKVCTEPRNRAAAPVKSRQLAVLVFRRRALPIGRAAEILRVRRQQKIGVPPLWNFRSHPARFF